MEPGASSSKLAVLLFTDIVGSTALKNRLGTTSYSSVLAAHNRLFEQFCREIAGAEVLKHTGDGYVATFGTVSDAVRCALLFQQAMRDQPWQPEPLTTRVGIDVGEVAVMEMAGKTDIVGVAADLASRVMSLAAGGQILMTRFPFNEARKFIAEHPKVDGKVVPPLKWVAHGQYLIRGSDEPIDVFEVGADGIAPLKPPPDNEKARRVVPHDQEQTLGWRPAVGLEVPQRVGWMLVEKLGEGGFGEVWLARHTRTKQHRVFKFCFDAERLRSFKRELTLFRLLRDALGDRKDISRLYDVKLDEPPFFLESDYTPGGNLSHWAESQGGLEKVSLPQRLEIVAQIADAVAAAHSIGVLHKDIKPSNILIHTETDGSITPRLCDFGIGMVTDREQLAARGITETGLTLFTENDSSRTGTRLYTPPESLVGKPFNMQGDIYAIGILLYQMALADLARPLGSGWEKDLKDPAVRQVVAACVHGDPSGRLGSAAEVSRRLRQWLANRTEKSRFFAKPVERFPIQLAPATVDSHGMISADVACRRCSYNLRALPHEGRCPECGTPAGLSTSGDLLRYADPVWLIRIRRGMGLCFFGCLLGGFGSFAILGSLHESREGAIALFLLDLLPVLLVLWGMILLTSRDPSGLSESQYARTRKFARVAVWLGSVAIVVHSVLRIPVTRAVIGDSSSNPLLLAVAVLAGLSSLVMWVPAFYILAQLARRVPNRKLVDQSRLLFWFFLSFPALLFVGFAAPVVATRLGSSRSTSELIAFGVIGAVSLFLLLAAVRTVFLYGRFWSTLRKQTMLARETWASKLAGHAGSHTD